MPFFRLISCIFILAVLSAGQTLTANPLIESSVKLRVDEAGTHSWGTGTIIDTRSGEALILTCGHIFRDSKGQGNVEVHLFKDTSSVSVLGRCLYYDLEIDLALVAIRPPCTVKPAVLAAQSCPLQPNQQVFSVGCDGGGNPTVRQHRILSTDRVGTPQTNAVPFHYIQVSGAPVSGRSGGGLFTADGLLIGVCNTADPVENDGQFVPPNIIRYVLDQRKLTDVYKKADAGLAANVPAPILLQPLTPIRPVLDDGQVRVANEMPVISADAQEQAALEEIKRLHQDGNEIVVIVKNRRNPDIPIDVIYLNNMSRDFPEKLAKNTSENEPYNSVIFSSSGKETRATGQQPVSLTVPHY